MSRKNVCLRMIKIILICLLAMVIAASIFVGNIISKGPSVDSIHISPTGYLTVITDTNGDRIDSLSKAESNRVYVSLDEINLYCSNAFIAIEDARYYKHHGIDLRGIGRALFLGIKERDFSQGASTITQQLLKNNAFDNWMNEETFQDRLYRKIQEQYLAIRIEQRYSKDWILENYLNTINLGGGTRGVQVASQYYFNRDAANLTLAQASLIAGITQNPSAYNPMEHPDESLVRQHMVLDAMLDQGMISTQEYTDAVNEDVIGELRNIDEDQYKMFTWFEDALLRQVVADLMDTYLYTEDQAWDLIYSGGLTICSTQDSHIQTILDEEIASIDSVDAGVEASIVLIDNENGSVAALIGGMDKESSLTYNRALEAVRQPGSTIKVIGEYAAGLESGIFTLGTTVDDAPYTYSNGGEIHNSYGEYRGMTTIRKSIATSGNIVALKTYQQVGESAVFDYLHRFGISTLDNSDRNEALAIGGTYNGVTNLELTAAYHTIANQGVYVEPYFYTQVLDHDGNIILKRGDDHKQVISGNTAALLTSAMEDVMNYGTGTSASFSGIPLAGKSGTTNENRDTWFVGYSPYYTCGVWSGYDNSAPQTNGSYVKALWKSSMQRIHIDKEYKDFPNMDQLVQVTICQKCGNKAITGLCDKADSGNETYTECYVSGTEPKNSCTCHIKMDLCNSSHQPAGKYCPKDEVTTHIYMTSATAGTTDQNYLVPAGKAESCEVHTHIWSQLMEQQKQKSEEENQIDQEQGVDNSNENSDVPAEGWIPQFQMPDIFSWFEY